MQLDWFTIIAQIVNFAILILLLRHFLFKRITKAMDARREKISHEQEEARNNRERAEKLEQKYKNKLGEIDKIHDQKKQEAEADAEKHKKELIEKAKNEIEDKKNRWHKQLESQQDNMIEEIEKQSADIIYTISVRALAEIADSALETKAIDRFIDKIEESDAKLDADEVTVETAFDPDDDQKKRIEKALKKLTENGASINYKVDDSLIAGIRIIAGGKKIGWSIGDYLGDIESKMAEVIGGSQNIKTKKSGNSEKDSDGKSNSEEDNNSEE
ncbi:MAG: F0F1 ATP synthase subunit delta [Candidatus Kapaibacterium sp.]